MLKWGQTGFAFAEVAASYRPDNTPGLADIHTSGGDGYFPFADHNG
jgi:hypothetical protein